jgi:hypothetical protein
MSLVVVPALALVLLFALTSVAGCGGKEEGDPDAILAQASAAMKKIRGFHFVYEVQKPASAQPGKGLEIARITGDVNADGNMQADVDVTQGGIPLTIQLVVVDDTQYFNFTPGSNSWQAVAAAQSPVGELSLTAGTIRILDQITQTSYEGRESKEGTETHHVKGTVAAADVEAIAGAVNTDRPFPTDLWIGVDDSYVYEVQIAGAATPSEDPDIRRSIVLSRLDTYVEIKAPQ